MSCKEKEDVLSIQGSNVKDMKVLKRRTINKKKEDKAITVQQVSKLK